MEVNNRLLESLADTNEEYLKLNVELKNTNSTLLERLVGCTQRIMF